MTAAAGLKLVLRIYGVLALLAVIAVFMPRAWMVAVHDWLMPEPTVPLSPMGELLARLLSGWYVLVGGLLLLLSMDVLRHADTIRYVAVAWGTLMVVVSILAVPSPVPMVWVLLDTLFVLVFAALVLTLQRRIAAPLRDRATEDSTT